MADEVCSVRLIISQEVQRSCTGVGGGSEKWEQKRRSEGKLRLRLHKEQQHDGGSVGEEE